MDREDGDMNLPPDVLDRIMVLADLRTKVRLFEAGTLHLFVSAGVYKKLLEEVVKHYATAHRQNLSKCLQLLPFHVWDDGTPMKKKKKKKKKSGGHA